MSVSTSVEGLWVGKGPSVSVGVVVHDPDEAEDDDEDDEDVDDAEDVSGVGSSFFLQAAINGRTSPAMLSFLRNSLRSIAVFVIEIAKERLCYSCYMNTVDINDTWGRFGDAGLRLRCSISSTSLRLTDFAWMRHIRGGSA